MRAPLPAAEFLIVEHCDAVTTVTLNRPEKLNSFNLEMQRELFETMQALENDPSCRAIILTGAGRAFSSGQDLSERRAVLDGSVPDLGASLDRYYHPLIRLLRLGNTPVVAALNGVAAGAGANLALACDIVIAARSGGLVESFARLGLVPDCGGTWMLPRLVGEARARGLALLAEEVSAETAAQWGLVWKVLDDADLASEAQSIAQRLASHSAQSMRMMKQALTASWGNSLNEQLDLERDFQRRAGKSDDYREGVTAFFEKRSPQFNGV